MTRKNAAILWGAVLAVVMIGAVVSRSNPSVYLLQPVSHGALKIGGTIVIVLTAFFTFLMMSQDRLSRFFGGNRPILNAPHNEPITSYKPGASGRYDPEHPITAESDDSGDSDESGNSDNSDTVVLSRDTMIVAQNPQDQSANPDVPPAPMDPKLLLLFHEELGHPQQPSEDKKDKDNDEDD